MKIDEKEKEKSDEKEKDDNNEKKDDKATADNDVKAMEDCKETTDDEKTEAVPAASKPRPPKKLARQRVSYLEVQYNFYGLCSELYEAIAAHLDLSVDRFDLVMKTQLEYDSVGFIAFSDTVHASAPQRPAEPTVHLRTAQQLLVVSHCDSVRVLSPLEALAHRTAAGRVSVAVELHPLALSRAHGRALAPRVHAGLRGARADRRGGAEDGGEVFRTLAAGAGDGCRRGHREEGAVLHRARAES